MKCPYCGYLESKVVDSRPTDEGSCIRRRRECLSCGRRFTTYETVESVPLVVIKKDGSRQAFNRNKMLSGLVKACEKRPVALSQLEDACSEIEAQLSNSLEREIQSAQIGELVMEHLKKIDEVAYVRFASVYRQFKDIGTFMEELSKLIANQSPLEKRRPAAESPGRRLFCLQNVGQAGIIPGGKIGQQIAEHGCLAGIVFGLAQCLRGKAILKNSCSIPSTRVCT